MTYYRVWYIMEDFSEIPCWLYTSLESAHKYPSEGIKYSKGVIGYRVKMEDV